MAKKKPPLSARQIRRQQQRQAVIDNPKPAPVEPVYSSSDAMGPSVLLPVFSGMIVLGYLLFARGLATRSGNELSHHQALFSAVNAATLTGFQQARNPDDYTLTGRVLTLVLMLAGMLFSFICGGMAVVRIARLRFQNWHVVAWAFASILFAAVGGGLAIHASGGDRTFPSGIGWRGRFFADVFQAISAFGNCGLTVGVLPAGNSAAAMMVLLPLTILGGLGLPVLMDLADRFRGRSKLSFHSSTVLTWTAGSYLVITLILFLLRWPGVQATIPVWRGAFVDASVQAINARSAGFQFQSVSAMPQALTFVLVLVMIVGASPGGSAGGMKVTTIAELTRGTREVSANRSPGRPFGSAIIWLLTYMTMLVASTIGLLMSEPEIQLNRSLFLAASALGNVGLSYDRVDVSTAGLYVLSATMMLGRVAPVMMLWYVVDTIPEAKVAVG